MGHLEAVAEAIADNLASQSEVADVPDRYVDWIDPDELAAAAVDALGLTQEWGLQCDKHPLKPRLGEATNPDGTVTRVTPMESERALRLVLDNPVPVDAVRKAGVSRLVSPWVVQPERNQP